ncbi:MAG TPA: class I SAM-dependent methyltransferase [Gemmatimonadales bacterium]
MTFRDHFSAVAADYAAHRPHYPDSLFDFLADAAPARDAAWDAGTGTGQAAVGLARVFDHVTATDPSITQIERADPRSNVTYRLASAENSGLDDGAIDLVTAAQAVHWFDQPRFWAEARRVLKPRGVVAIWTYVTFEISPQIDAIVRRFYSGVVGPFWPPERRQVETRYQTITFPFQEFPAPSFVIEQQMSLDDVAGYVRTWSATLRFMKHHQRDPVDGLVKELTRAWGALDQLRMARWPVAMRIGRVE